MDHVKEGSSSIYKQNVSISLRLSDSVGEAIISSMGAIFQLWNMLGC